MKKNISINIFGTIYAIDEDAYQLLENYLQSMKNYFERQEGGDEIADDIEHRVAELLWEHKQQGMEAVTIDTIKGIIEKIGNPAEIAGDDNEKQADAKRQNNDGDNASDNANATDHEQKADNSDEELSEEEKGTFIDRIKRHLREKRLFRNTEDKILGGVCSGLSEYAGGDVTFWRLGALVLSFCHVWLLHDFFSFLPILYIVCWIIVPEARSAEDRLRMKGKKVTPENLTEQLVNDSEGRTENKQTTHPQRGGCLRSLFFLLLILSILPLILCILGLIFVFIVLVVFSMSFTPLMITLSPDAHSLTTAIQHGGSFLWIGVTAGLVLCGIPVYAIVRCLRSNSRRLTTGAIVTLVVSWLISLALVIYSVTFFSLRMKEIHLVQDQKESVRHGIMLNNKHEWRMLDDMGWSILKLENVKGDITERRSGFGGLPHAALRIRPERSGETVTLQMENKDYYEEGKYVLECLCEVKGSDITLKVLNDGETTVAPSVIHLNTPGVRLDTIAPDRGMQLPIFFTPDSSEWKDFAQDKKERWVYHVSEPFTHQGGNMTILLEADKAKLRLCHLRVVQLRKLEDSTENKQEKKGRKNKK